MIDVFSRPGRPDHPAKCCFHVMKKGLNYRIRSVSKILGVVLFHVDDLRPDRSPAHLLVEFCGFSHTPTPPVLG